MAIAITGLACRLPGDGNNLNNFWDSICNGTSAWSQIPRDRFNPAAFPAAIPQGAHFLNEDISLFDANFFRISHNEARAMDPQQRLMLEVVYEALEAGGYPMEALAGTPTAVYMGQFTSDYKELVCRDPEAALPFSVTGLQPTSLANRISWLFDLKGPSLTMDTACSSSLVALHLACQSLRAGEAQMAIVGGCNLMISPDMFIFEAGQGFLSPDGKCKTFDQSANGYGRGEGFAAVVLKPLDLAVRDGDLIRAVIRGTGSNQDGHTKGFTLPSSEAQASLIRSVYRSAGLEFDETGYVEAHGTGTKAGDLEETTALAKTIAAVRPDGRKLIVGSVKSNIGHLEAAAGLASMMKSVMMLETGKIPPNIHLQNPNPNIKFDEWNLKVPTAMTPWPTDGLRRISIDSFGYGGSNAHIVLDDAHSYLSQNGIQGVHATKARELNGASRAVWEEPRLLRRRVFPISAQDKDGIGRVKKVMASFLTEKSARLQTVQEKDYLDDLAFTLSERRSHLQWKTFLVASSLNELVDALGSEETTAPAHLSSRKPRLGFVFTGQGAQWANMGMELIQYQVFRNSIEAADRYLRQDLGCQWSAAEELARGKSTSKLRRALYSQALCTILQVALVDLLREWGIVPEAVVGHSSGEIAAAYCLGTLSREDAWKIAYFRGVMSSKLEESGLKGAMVAVGASPEEAAELISQLAPDKVHIACINSPQSVTLSGDADAIHVVFQALQEKGVFSRRLQVEMAYHSPHMHLVAREYLEAILDISTTTKSPRGDCRMYSSVTGEVVESEELGPVYWVRNLMSPVQFSPAIQQLAGKENALDILVEVGPHSALQGPSTQSLQSIGITDIPYHSVLVRYKNGIETALNLVGNLSANGYPVRFREVNPSKRTPRPLVDLPSYPWNHSQGHWAESRVAREYRLRASPYNSLLGAPVPRLVVGERVWRRRIRLSEQPWIADHKIQGSVFYPGAGFIASAIEAALSTVEVGRKVAKFRLRDVNLKAALPLNEDDDVEYSVGLRPHLAASQDTSSPWTEFTIGSCRDGKTLERNCLGLIMLEYESPNVVETEESLMLRYQEATEQCRTVVKPEPFYQSLSSIGFHYGPAFQNVTEIRTGRGQSCGVVDIPDVGPWTPQRPHIIHPATLDAIFHLVFAALGSGPDGVTQAMVPKTINEVVISADIPFEAGSQLKGFSNASRRGFKDILADIVMNDEARNLPVLKITGFVCTEIGGGSSESADPNSARSVCSSLVWRPAINLLQLEEQEAVITQAVSARQEVDPACNDSGPSIAAAVSELIKLMHHCNPRMLVSEAVASKSTAQPILGDSRALADVLKTANCRIWCSDESARQAIQETCQISEEVQIELRDLTKPLPSDEAPLQASDLVIIPLALSDPETVEQTIRNAKQLLTSDGRLCLTVPARQSEDVEALGRRIGLSNWIKINDFEDPDRQQLTLLIGANSINPAQNEINRRDEVIILQPPIPSQAAARLSENLRECLASLGYAASFQSWEDSASSWTGKSCISLLEIDSPMLEDLTEADFNRIKSLILETNKILWISGHGGPSSAIVAGLARVVRNEEPGLAFHTLQLDFSQYLCADRLAELILRAFDNDSRDNEYMIENEVIHVSRVLEDDDMNGKLHLLSHQNSKTMSEVALGKAVGPLKLCVQNASLLDPLCFELDPVANTVLGEDEVEITVKAASVSVRDVMTIMGQVPGRDLGFDAAGVVRRVGSAVTRYNIGDRVVMCNPGAHRTVLRAKTDFCELIPGGMTFEEAATIPLAHGTAWYALMRLVRVQKGQTILIHSAAGGVGQAAIQIAQHLGMEIFATVGSDAKRALLRDAYGVTDDHIFNSRDLSFFDGVKRMTNGRGVDVVLNSLSGEALRQTWYCVAPFGTFIEMGVKDMLGNSRLDMRPFLQDASFTSVDLKRISQQRPDIMAGVMQGAFELLKNGVTKPIAPLAVFPASEVESAFRFVETGQNLGKAVLTFSDEEVVSCLHRHELSLDLDPEAAYVLAGGLGGLGRGIARMLVDNGARRLCFLSRWGVKSPAAQELVRDLESRGVQVLVQACNIADPEAVQDAVELCSQQLGHICGVIQCAMVLRDTLFRNMTHQEWVESTRPKVQGTWNLHQSLPGVDFFVTLGSFTAIFGNRGQSNYAAGGAYQDAVAHFRRAQGLHAVTIDVGVVRDAGVLAEQGMLNTLQEFEGPYGLDEDELLKIIKLAVAGDVSGIIAPQLLTGLATGGSAIAAGVDPAWYLDDAKFSIMAQTGSREVTGKIAQQQDTSVQTRLSEATSRAEAAGIVLDALVNRVANMLQTDRGEIDTNRFLHSYGIDSLVAIQVVSWALKEIKSQITVLDLMAGVPITETARKIAAKSMLLPKALDDK